MSRIQSRAVLEHYKTRIVNDFSTYVAVRKLYPLVVFHTVHQIYIALTV